MKKKKVQKGLRHQLSLKIISLLGLKMTFSVTPQKDSLFVFFNSTILNYIKKWGRIYHTI